MSQPPTGCSVAETVKALAEQVRQIEGQKRQTAWGVVSSGSKALDRILPDGGFRPGSLVEWLAAGLGSGAATLALWAAREAAAGQGTLVVIDRKRLFYPPAAIALGIDPRRLIVVRPTSDKDHAWALDQVLRSTGVAAVWCFSPEQDDHAWRRWQLAAESSGVLGLLVTAQAARHQSCWANLRLLVEPIARPEGRKADRRRRLRVELLHAHAAGGERIVEVEIPAQEVSDLKGPSDVRRGNLKYETRTVHLASQLAAAKARRRSRRA